MSGLTKKQVEQQYHMSGTVLLSLLKVGVLRLSPSESKQKRLYIDPESLLDIREGEHYIECLECREKIALVTSVHLKRCSNMTSDVYFQKHPDAPVLSNLTHNLKTKTEKQKSAQSEKLKARFQTPEGEITRQQIAEASQRLMLNGGLERVTKQLTELSKTPARRADVSAQSKAQWATEEYRQKVQGWHHTHREESLAGAANARRHITRKRTKLHAQLKAALVHAGVQSETEYEVGYYAIDEAVPDVKLSIEADGCYWHGCTVCGFPGHPQIAHYDKAKESYLRNRGWTILHFPGHEIKKDADACACVVTRTIERLRNGSRD